MLLHPHFLRHLAEGSCTKQIVETTAEAAQTMSAQTLSDGASLNSVMAMSFPYTVTQLLRIPTPLLDGVKRLASCVVSAASALAKRLLSNLENYSSTTFCVGAVVVVCVAGGIYYLVNNGQPPTPGPDPVEQHGAGVGVDQNGVGQQNQIPILPQIIDAMEDFRDPITFETLTDPVILVTCGHGFNRGTASDFLGRYQRFLFFLAFVFSSPSRNLLGIFFPFRNLLFSEPSLL
jgi:hypothetical protein